MKTRPWMISRRTMLRGLGAMVALPKLDIMAADVSTAVGAAGTSGPVDAPMRFLSVFTPNGVYPEAWDVDGVGRDYAFSPILSPLEHLRDDLTILSGLDNVTSGHVRMTASFLSGVAIREGKGAVSLDQKLAQHLGQNTLFPSIVLGTEPPRQGRATGEAISIASTVSWSSETTRVSPEINPRVAFDRLFRTGSEATAKRDAELQLSVIDSVLEDAKSLRRKASSQDQQKIDEYLESIRSVELRMERTIDPPLRQWTPPTKPGRDDLHRPDPGLPRDRSAHLKMMIDLIVLALWTDTTRVATLMAAHGFSRQNFSFLDGVSGDHHGISHHKEQSGPVQEYTRVSRWYVEQFAYLLDRLKGIDEGGRNLLENSVVLYGSGMKDGNGHKTDNLPLVLAGHGRGTLNPGQHLKLPSQPLPNLHATIAQKFGLEKPDFNEAGGRPIPELG